MNKTLVIAGLAILLVVLAALSRLRGGAAAAKVDGTHVFGSDPGGVMFTIAPASVSPPGYEVWTATYTNEGHTAKFRLVLSMPKKSTDDPNGITFAKGRIEAIPGSDAQTLLSSLRTALRAEAPLTPVQHVDSLSFTMAYMGSKFSRAEGGGFNAQPPGTWIATKLFIPAGDEMDEVYLNLSPQTNKAEFSIKDESFGDSLLQQFASVL
jgi:hypothetical protein